MIFKEAASGYPSLKMIKVLSIVNSYDLERNIAQIYLALELPTKEVINAFIDPRDYQKIITAFGGANKESTGSEADRIPNTESTSASEHVLNTEKEESSHS